MKCVRHGEMGGKVCLACKAEREQRNRANYLLVTLVGLAVLALVVAYQAGLILP